MKCWIAKLAAIGSLLPSTAWAFTIPAGRALSALKLLTYQQPGGVLGNRGFHAIAAGASSVIPDGSNSAALLGGAHLDPAPSGTDLLPALASDTILETPGFARPLRSGTYTYRHEPLGTGNARDWPADGCRLGWAPRGSMARVGTTRSLLQGLAARAAQLDVGRAALTDDAAGVLVLAGRLP